jgi:CDP-glucose 4,6-dehydratase
VPVIITRVGSCFGPKGRSDELPHRLIIYALKNRKFYLRSPRAKRLWTYSRDAIRFYERLFEKLDECVGLTLHCAGNKNNEILENIELARMVKKLTNDDMEIIEGEYELGEIVDGKPIEFQTDCSFTRELLGWKPKYSVEEGLRRTIEWFKKNLWRYI